MTKPKLTKQKLAIEVAKDVLKWMKYLDVRTQTGYLRPTNGIDNNVYRVITDFDGDAKKIQKNIPKIAKKCTVCAAGAMILGYIHLYDGNDCIPENDESYRMADKIFGIKQIREIESAFELPIDPALAKLEPKARLRAIMKQIIASDGVFKENK